MTSYEQNLKLELSCNFQASIAEIAIEVYKSRNSQVSDKLRDPAFSFLCESIGGVIADLNSKKQRHFLNDKCDTSSYQLDLDELENKVDSNEIKVETLQQFVLLTSKLIGVAKDLLYEYQILNTQLTQSDEIYDEDCEAYFYDNTYSNQVLRFEHSKACVSLGHSKSLLFSLESSLTQVVCSPHDTISQCKNNGSLMKDVAKQALVQRQYWTPIHSEINQINKHILSNYLQRYQTASVHSPSDVLDLPPPVPPKEPLNLGDDSNTIEGVEHYILAKKRKQEVDIDTLDVPEQVEKRKQDTRTEKAISYFGGSIATELDTKQWFKGYFSSVYGYVIVLEGGHTVGNSEQTAMNNNCAPSTTNVSTDDDAADEEETVVTTSNNNLVPRNPIVQPNIQWSDTILRTLGPIIDNMSMSTSDSFVMKPKLDIHIRQLINFQFFSSDSNIYCAQRLDCKSFCTQRSKLSTELNMLSTRLLREFQFFNPRTLDIAGNASSNDYDDVKTKYVFKTILKQRLHSQIDNNEGVVGIIQTLNDSINGNVMSFNMGMIHSTIIRELINGVFEQNCDHGNRIALTEYWIDVMTKLIIRNTTKLIMEESDHILCLVLFNALSAGTPLSKHVSHYYTQGNLPTIDSDQTDHILLFTTYQETNIESLQTVVHATSQVTKYSTNQILLLCCIGTHATIIKSWSLCCCNTFTARSERGVVWHLKVPFFPSMFISATVALLQQCFLELTSHNRAPCIWLVVGLIQFMKGWILQVEVTKMVCYSHSVWSTPSGSGKAFKFIFTRLSQQRRLADNILKEIKSTLSPSTNASFQKECESFEFEQNEIIHDAFQELNRLVDAVWY
jgi:hypothetical protein